MKTIPTYRGIKLVGPQISLTTFRLTPGITAMLAARPPELSMEERITEAWRAAIVRADERLHAYLNTPLWADLTPSQGGVTSPGRMVSL